MYVTEKCWEMILRKVVDTHKAYNPQYIMLNKCLLQVGVLLKMAEWITEPVFCMGARSVAKGRGVLGPPNPIPLKIIKDKTGMH